MGRIPVACCVGAIMLLGAACGRASAVEVYQEYRKRIESAQNLTALKNDLFGDSVSLFNGKTDFSVIDIDLPGNSALPVRLQRKFSVELHLAGGANFNSSLEGAGGWDVDVPHISGIFAPVDGWASDRCSGSMVPFVNSSFNLTEIWQGNTIHIPEEGDRVMLGKREDTPAPSDGAPRKWTTSQRDAIDCIQMKSGLSGEGFRVTTTQGISYHFDVAVQRYAGQLRKSVGAGVPVRTVGRSRVYLLASKVEDRFGNFVRYEYNSSGNPVRIWSSDSREISAAYSNGMLISASTSGRTWGYSYVNVEGQSRLARVTLPDGSSWKYGYSNALSPSYVAWDGNSRPDCSEQPPPVPAAFTFTAEHPGGAIGSFLFSNSRHYRSGVHMTQCAARLVSDNWGSNYYYELTIPNFFDVMSLYRKTISGPGIAQPLVWSYGYGGGYQPLWGTSGGGARYPCADCAPEKSTVVVNPDGTRTSYRYGFMYALNEGKLLGSSVEDASGKILRSNSTRYMTTDEVSGQPFTAWFGTIYNGDDPSTAQVRPVLEESIAQDGTVYRSYVNSFDGFGRARSVTKSSPLGSRTDVTDYHDNTGRWVLGQVAKVTSADSGKVISQTSYNETDLPHQIWSFGKLKQAITYHSDGTASVVKDGRGNATALAAWKLGVPQSITYADGTSQSASVDDRGWITSIKNENDDSTEYRYDPMGRVASVIHPKNDAVQWNSTEQSFQQVGASEYGIAPGHWRQIISTGAARKEIYFDAFLRVLLTREYDTGNVSESQRFQRFSYDYAGRNTFSSYVGSGAALSAGAWSDYDPLGRLVASSIDSEKGLLTTRTEYLSGNRVRVTNPLGHATESGFQAFDEPSYEAPIWIRQPEGAYTDIDRDIFSKPLSIVRRNADSTQLVTRKFVYDQNERLCKMVEPETGTTVMQHDAADNVAWSAGGLNLPGLASCDFQAASNSGRRIDRSYDKRNRVVSIVFPDGNGNQSWTYTKDGKPAKVISANDHGNATVENRYSYLKRGMLSEEHLYQTGESPWAIGYRYDMNGSVSGHSYPSGLVVDYGPNALGQPMKASNYATGVKYHPNGAVKQFTYGNGLVHSMVQNERGMTAQVRDGAILNDTYDYDRNGNVVQITDAITPDYSRSMAYDGLDRLVRAQSKSFGGDATYRYTYDALDNLRSTKLGGKRQENYWYDATNRLMNIQNDSGATIGALFYDVQGNVVAKSGPGTNQEHVFDLGNRLRSVVGKESYRYDAHGRRASAYDPGGGSTISMYGQDGVLRRQDNRRQGKSYEYVYLNGSLVAKVVTEINPAVPVLTVPNFNSTGNYPVAWNAVVSANRYELQESIVGGAWAAVYSGVALSKEISNKATGNYAYRVRACRDAVCSVWSSVQSVAVKHAPTQQPVITVPASAPNGTYIVSWTQVSGAESYRLEQSLNGGSWILAKEAPETSVSYKAVPVGSYAYRVRACNSVGCGPVSAVATTQALYPPALVPGLSSPAQNLTGSYVVSWGSAAAAATYRLEESINNGAWAQVQETASRSTAFIDKPYGTYSYRIRACNAAGCGGYSGAVTSSVIRPPSQAPALSVPARSSTGSYTVSWGAVGLATSYQLEESVGGGAWGALYAGTGTASSVAGRGNSIHAYRVRGCNAAGCGPLSAVASIEVLAPPPIPSIRSSWQQQTSPAPVRVACGVGWNAVASADRYELWSYANGQTYQKQYDGPLTSVSTSLGQNRATYCAPTHVVRACNSSGCSSFSEPVQQPVEIIRTGPGGVVP